MRRESEPRRIRGIVCDLDDWADAEEVWWYGMVSSAGWTEAVINVLALLSQADMRPRGKRSFRVSLQSWRLQRFTEAIAKPRNQIWKHPVKIRIQDKCMSYGFVSKKQTEEKSSINPRRSEVTVSMSLQKDLDLLMGWVVVDLLLRSDLPAVLPNKPRSVNLLNVCFIIRGFNWFTIYFWPGSLDDSLKEKWWWWNVFTHQALMFLWAQL